jgi:hypothetical protein
VNQRYRHLEATQLFAAYVVLDDAVASSESLLFF